jgi:uncharacterized membrane protein
MSPLVLLKGPNVPLKLAEGSIEAFRTLNAMMATNELKVFTCSATGKTYPAHECIKVGDVSLSLRPLLNQTFPQVGDDDVIGPDALRKVRRLRLEQLMIDDNREVTDVEKEVLASIEHNRIFAHDPDDEVAPPETFGNRIADQVASFGGSWKFIGIFFAILVAWIIVNSTALLAKPYDPYPFILLNLVLSCVAAIQAPVIMMSQNRQETKDRARSMHDYQVNLKAELEIRSLHEKLDRLMGHEWHRLLEVQQIQLDLMEDLSQRRTS